MSLRILASESASYGVVRVAATAAQLAIVPIWTHALSKPEFGLNALLAHAAVLCAILSVSGFDNGMWSIYYDKTSEVQRQAVASFFWLHLTISVLLSIFGWICVDWWAPLLPGADGSLLFAVLIQATLAAGQTVFFNWVRAVRRPQLAIAISIIQCVLTVGVQWLLLTEMKLGLRGAWLGQVAVSALMSGLALIFMRDWCRISNFRWHLVSEMWAFAWPVIPAGIAAWILAAGGSFFVRGYDGTEDVADLRLAGVLAAAVGLATSAFQQAWPPFFLSVKSQPNHRAIYARAFIVYTGGIGFACAAVCLLAPELAALMAPSSYAKSVVVVPLLCFSTLIGGMIPIAVTSFVLAKRMRPLGLVLTGSSLLSLALNFLFVPSWGIVGAGAAALIAQILAVLTLFRLGRRTYSIPFRFGSAGVIVAACAALAWSGLHWFGGSAAGALATRMTLLLVLGGLLWTILRGHVQELQFPLRLFRPPNV